MPISKHEEKMVTLQRQVRHNQTELHDYMKDLDSWAKDIKEKEKNISKQSSGPQNGDLPPVRNTIHKKKLKKKKKITEEKSKPTQRISGFDFKAWDKFDVDQALQEIDDKKESDTSSSEYETDEEWEMERKKHLASAQKDEGNKLLKKGDNEMAVEAYTKGMRFDPTCAILPANRALAFIKQEKYAAAELDCTTSITLDPLYVKAYLRRATARTGLGKTGEALADYERVLDLEPNNKSAKSEMEKINNEIERHKQAPVTASLTKTGRGVVKPIYKTTKERSKIPLHRVNIEEIGVEKEKTSIDIKQSETAKKIVLQENEQFDKLFTAKSEDSPNSVHPETKSPPPDLSINLDNSKADSTDNKNNDSINLSAKQIKKNDQNISEISPDKVLCSNETTDKIVSDTSNTKALRSSLDEPLACGDGPVNNSVLIEDSFTTPTTSYQFQNDFKKLHRKPALFFKYFQQIPTSKYPSLFGASFDASVLTSILHALDEYYQNPDVVYEVLDSLTRVKRFSMTAMFMSAKDKEVLGRLENKMKECTKHSTTDVLKLKQKYMS